MRRENRKEAIATLHRKQIMKAAEKLFSEKGYRQTTIEDISKASEYSRRTIYSYYESKEDILHHIIEKGLIELKEDIENAINYNEDFIIGYKAIWMAMSKYQSEYHHSSSNVNSVKVDNFDFENFSDTLKHILSLGEEINAILAEFIERGKEKGIVRKDVNPMLSVYVLWSSITSFLTLAATKGKFITKQFNISENDFIDYGFKQIINSILEEQI